VENFGLQWGQFSQTQIDSNSGYSRSRDRLLNEVWSLVSAQRGQVVVDAGCGSGRFTEIALELGATVIAIDLSGSVDATYRQFGKHPNCHVVQADLLKMPLDFSQVSGLYSIGVLQHTRNPYLTARLVARQLDSDSWFAFTAYGRRPWTPLGGKYLVRPLTRRLDAKRLLRIVEFFVPVVEPKVRVLASTRGISRLVRFLSPVATYPEFDYASEAARLEEAVLDTMDMLGPTYDHPLDARRLCEIVQVEVQSASRISSRPAIVIGKR